jgi:DNA-binding MurR/RpiR family transcriptional regulator
VYNWTKIHLEDIRQGAKILGAKACVFYLLKMYAGKSPDKLAYPSQSSIADITGLSQSSVAKALKQLKLSRWIEFRGYTDTNKRTAIWAICEPFEREGFEMPRDDIRPLVRSYNGGMENLTRGGMENLTNNKRKTLEKEKHKKQEITIRYSPKF